MKIDPNICGGNLELIIRPRSNFSAEGERCGTNVPDFLIFILKHVVAKMSGRKLQNCDFFKFDNYYIRNFHSLCDVEIFAIEK